MLDIEIGRQFPISSLEPFLWRSTVEDKRQEFGMYCSRRMVLKMVVNMWAPGSNFFNTEYLMRSGPGVVFLHRLSRCHISFIVNAADSGFLSVGGGNWGVS